jgi:hypothetical protein
MRFEVSHDEIKKANVPHELSLTNLIGNHILMAVAAGGIAGSIPWIMAVIPVVSVGILPVMVTVLVLIIIESDALYHANQAKLPSWVVERFPDADVRVLPDEPEPHYQL